jgi:hypothetical protein
MQEPTPGTDSPSTSIGGYLALTADFVALLAGLTVIAFAFVGLIFWFSGYANALPEEVGALSPYLLALLGALIAGSALIASLRDDSGSPGLLSWAARLGIIAAAGFVTVGGVVPEFRGVQEGTDWAIFKWVALVGFYGGSVALSISVALLLWRLSRVRTELGPVLGKLSMPSLSLPKTSRPRLVIRRGSGGPPIVGE